MLEERQPPRPGQHEVESLHDDLGDQVTDAGDTELPALKLLGDIPSRAAEAGPEATIK